MMDRHSCKLCFRRFANGRALGGHMRSHVTFGSAGVGGKTQLREAAAATSPSSSASAFHGEAEEAEEVGFQVGEPAREEGKQQFAYYGLRENPRKSFRLVDPEFSSTFPAVDYAAAAVGGGGSSVVLVDGESETESSKPPSLRRRSKRSRRVSPLPVAKSDPSVEPEPVSSISDATPEQDVARCLMMLSRDAWGSSSSLSPAAKRKRSCREDEEEHMEEEEEQNSDDGSEEELATVVRARRGARSRYRCETCGKVFRTYQALGGHRASHKKVKACTASPHAAAAAVGEEEDDRMHPHLDNPIQDADSEVNAAAPSTGSTDRRIHECPVCFRVFGSGQALGGHKRSHLAYSSGAAAAAAARTTAAATTTASATASAVSPADANRTRKLVLDSFIDLNLPPPMDEEVETSAI